MLALSIPRENEDGVFKIYASSLQNNKTVSNGFNFHAGYDVVSIHKSFKIPVKAQWQSTLSLPYS